MTNGLWYLTIALTALAGICLGYGLGKESREIYLVGVILVVIVAAILLVAFFFPGI